MSYYCKECGRANEYADNCSGSAYPLSEENIDYFVRLECVCCKSRVTLSTVKEQGIQNWHVVGHTGALFCPSCWHEINGTISN